MNDGIVNVHALVDGEIEESEKTATVQAIASDPKLAAEREWAVLFKSRLKDKLAPVRDDGVWQDCRRRLDEVDRVNRAQSFVGRFAWAFCALFLAGMLFAAGMDRMNPDRQLGSEHVAGLLNGLQEYKGDTGDLFEELKGITGESAYELRNSLKIVAGAEGWVDGRRALRLVLDDGRGQVNLFRIEMAGSLEGLESQDSGYRSGTINDSQAISWKHNGALIILVGQRNMAELRQIAESVRSTGG